MSLCQAEIISLQRFLKRSSNNTSDFHLGGSIPILLPQYGAPWSSGWFLNEWRQSAVHVIDDIILTPGFQEEEKRTYKK